MKKQQLFTKEEIKKIEAALSKAEKGSDGEIVPIFAKVSGNYSAAKYIFALLLGIASLAIAFEFTDSKILTILAVILPVILGLNLVHFFPHIMALFTPKSQMRYEVERRACEYFYKYNLGATKKGSALLIYVSCFERMAVVKTDLCSTSIVPHSHLQEVCNLVTKGMKEKNPAQGLILAIEKYGKILKETFPNNSKENVNELPNKLILIDL